MRQEAPTKFGTLDRSPSRELAPYGARKWLALGTLTFVMVVCTTMAKAEGNASSPRASAASSTTEQPRGYPPCEETPSDNDVAAAKGAFQAGKTSFEEGDYERAILYWEDAFRRDCTAVKLLLNVARAYELNGELMPAVVALSTYVERDPDLEDRDAVEKRIEKLRARYEREQLSAPPSSNAEPASAQREPAQPAPSQGASHDERRPWWPVVTTAAGVAGLAVGTTFAVLGQVAVSNEKDRIAQEVVQTDQNGDPVLDPETGEPIRCSRKGLNWDCPTSELKDAVEEELDSSKELKRAKAERTVGIIVAGGGVAITAVGAYFWYRLWQDAPSSALSRMQPMLLPVVTPLFRGLAVSGHF